MFIFAVLIGFLFSITPLLNAKKEIIVNLEKQQLYLKDNDTLLKTYAVSTSGYGIGSKPDSNCTPLGKHTIYQKVGAGAASGTVFKGGVTTRKITPIFKNSVPKEEQQDMITTRILQLHGLEKENSTSQKRGIWIHGTPYEGDIGTPVSHGCIRMKNDDIRELFELVSVGTELIIRLN